jgi:CRP/FNR family transcriptional regulator
MDSRKTGVNNCVDCDRRSPLFEYLSKEELSRINAVRSPLHYEPGEMIVKQGAPASYVLSFVSGLAKIVVESRSQQNMIVKLVLPKEFISGPGLFVNGRQFFSIIALEKSHVCAIDSVVFKEILQNNHTFNEHYLSHVNENYLIVVKKLLSSFEKQTKGRVAETILYLADEIYKQESFDLSFSIIDLASLSGMSKESAFRCIKEFTDDGILSVSKKRVEIYNIDQLREISLKG